MIVDPKETKYGDLIALSYNGYEYAELDSYGRYGFFDLGEALTRYRSYSYLKSVFKKYTVYAVKDDTENIFLYCDVTGPFYPIGTTYYRSDYEFPELKSDNIEEIKVHDDEQNVLCTLEDREMIKYFFCEKTKIKYDDIMTYIEVLNIKSTTANEDIYVTAKFNGSSLHYSLGMLDETDREYYEYGERDDTDDYDGYDVFE